MGYNSEQAKKFASFEKDFDKKAKKSFGKTSAKYGRRMVKHRLRQLGPSTAQRRKDGVWYKVTRNGGLVFLDLAPMASAQEFGRTISPSFGDYLRVPISPHRGLDPNADTFVVRSNSGDLILMQKTGGEPEPIAVLKTKIVIKRASKSGRFATAVDAELKNYKEEFIEELLKEMRK